ncbi:MAG: hypothetical protein ACYCRD_05595 [Leptospirillum sp.]
MVLFLVNFIQIVPVDTLHADIHMLTSRFYGQIQELPVMVRVQLPQTAPGDVERSQGLEKLAGESVLSSQLVVDKLKLVVAGDPFLLFDFLDDILNF